MKPSWPLPSVGDIVWSMFPELPNCAPGPKPRPALVISVERREEGDVVRIAYGTSQNVTRLKAGEFAIIQATQSAAYAVAGLAYDTKFDLKVIVDVAWSERYFKVPLRNPHGNTPKIGTLHASVMHAVQAAYRAAVSR